MTNSLRIRLLVGTTLSAFVVLSLMAVAVYLVREREMLRGFDAGLRVKAQTLGAMTAQRGGRITFEAEAERIPEYSTDTPPDYFEIVLADGRALARSPSLGDGQLKIGSGNRQLPDGRLGRIISERITPHAEPGGADADIGLPAQGQDVWVVLAVDLSAHNSRLADLRWVLAESCGMAILVSGLALWLVVGRAMRPVNRLAAEIGTMDEADLSRRLDTQGVPGELRPVVERLNGLLDRLAVAFDREKSFASHVAHELRTPLSAMRTMLQVCRMQVRDPLTYQATIDKGLALTTDMGTMVERLLLLARVEAGQLPVVRQPMNLGALASECWGAFRQRAGERGLTATTQWPVDCVVQSDPDQWRMVLNNLFDNAVSYCEPGGTIRIEVERNGHGVLFAVGNTFAGMSPEDLAHVFDRFWRADLSRSQTGRHCGLGLSLCQKLVGPMGGEISIQADGGQFRVQLKFAE